MKHFNSHCTLEEQLANIRPVAEILAKIPDPPPFRMELDAFFTPEQARGLYQSRLRYEFLRTLNPQQFAELWEKCLKGGVRFDDEVDRMREERADGLINDLGTSIFTDPSFDLPPLCARMREET